MAHHSLADLLQKAFSSSVKEDETFSLLMKKRAESRRKFLRDTAYAAGGLVLVPSFLRASTYNTEAISNNKVVIIGAGIAGLNACYQLKKQGIHATVYEAGERAGGRMFTMKDQFGKGITTDIGGEFVDSSHADIRQLVTELGLSFYDLKEDSLAQKTLYFEGRKISDKDLKAALKPFVNQLVKDIGSLPASISYETADTFRYLDDQSITEYISGIGISGWLYNFLNVVMTREYGMEASEQSAVNFLIMFIAPGDDEKEYELFGGMHEVLKIKGGSQHLTDTLYQQVKEQVVLKHKLVAVDKNQSTGYDLSIENNGAEKNIKADYVLLTVPFSILRKIRLAIDLPAGKRKCIEEIGYGNSCKFVMGMNNKPWRNAGRQGYTFTDISFGCGWDSTQSQPGNKGSFTVFAGGNFGDDLFKNNKEELAGSFVPSLEQIYPGSQKAYSGKTLKFCWGKNPFSQGGYSSFKKGQWSTLAGWEAVPVGNVYFAGEHTSRDFQGYMNGGAQTAREAAENIVKKIAQQA